MNTYVSQEDDVYDKLIDVAHHHEAVIEGKRVAHQILDSDGKVNTVLLQIILLIKIKVRKHTFHVDFRVMKVETTNLTSLLIYLAVVEI